MSSPASHAAEQPIINPDAWNVEGPKLTPQPVRAEVAKCNPWEVSDIAMEAVLEEMRQRGWRPPGSVERAIADGNAEIVAAYEPGLEQVSANVPQPAPGQSVIAVVSDAEADRIWRDADEAKVKKVSADVAQPATPIP